MSWQNIDLTKINPQAEIIPEKTYTFELAPGAKYDERDPGRILVSASIVNDGEFTGRRVFFSYPDPESFNSKGNKNDWSAKALVRLLTAVGADLQEGEDPVSALNRAAGGRFTSKVTHSKPTEEYPNPRANLDIFNPKPAA